MGRRPDHHRLSLRSGTLDASATARAEAKGGRGGFIAGPAYDAVFFLGAPALALAIGIAISGTDLADEPTTLLGHEGTATSLFIGTFIFAHLGLVFVRSHLNPAVFRLHPRRFVAAPALLLGLLVLSDWALAVAIVLTTWWDAVHSALQTFGLGRIYDARRGNPPAAGRRLDLWLNVVLYLGPILGGAVLLEHLQSLRVFERFDLLGVRAIPIHAEAWQGTIARALLVVGTGIVIAYVLGYRRLARQGYRVSPQKVFLYATTGLCSLYSWGLNSWGEAFFIMNFFHAWQYFALVWYSEREVLRRRIGLQAVRWGRAAALALMLAASFGYGLWAELVESTQRTGLAIVTVIALLHFWYDGFIWSVRRGQV